MPRSPSQRRYEEPLLNGIQAARALGVSRFYVLGVKRASKGQSDNPYTGRFTTYTRITRWLEKHPDFVASHYIRLPSRDAA